MTEQQAKLHQFFSDKAKHLQNEIDLEIAKEVGEEPMTASGRNLIGSEVKQSKRAPRWGVAPTELADSGC